VLVATGRSEIRDEPCDVHLQRTAGHDLEVRLTWHTTRDDEHDDETYSDLDLHLVRPEGRFFCMEEDAFTRTERDWGVPGDPADDPIVGEDHRHGLGPEVVSLARATPGHYEVGVYSYQDQLFPTRAVVTVLARGVRVWQRDTILMRERQFWHAATLFWLGGADPIQIVAVDRVLPETPSCPR